MNEEQFKAMLATIFVPPVVEYISEYYQLDEITSTEIFYTSKVYEALSDEDLKVWHYSPLLLFEMFKEENEKGFFTYPEEGLLA